MFFLPIDELNLIELIKTNILLLLFLKNSGL